MNKAVLVFFSITYLSKFLIKNNVLGSEVDSKAVTLTSDFTDEQIKIAVQEYHAVLLGDPDEL